MNVIHAPHQAEALLLASTHWRNRQQANAEAPSPVPTACTIAISREAGALGSSVGQELATRLGWQLYDQELLQRIGAEMGLRASLLASVDEHRTNWVRELVDGFATHKTISSSSYVHHLIEMLLSLASHGECIIVGRGAPHVLPQESTLRVRLVAPRAFRISAIQKMRGLPADQAARWVDTADQERASFVKANFHKDLANPDLYDLIVNVARFPVPQVAGLIIAALRDLEQNRRSR